MIVTWELQCVSSEDLGSKNQTKWICFLTLQKARNDHGLAVTKPFLVIERSVPRSELEATKPKAIDIQRMSTKLTSASHKFSAIYRNGTIQGWTGGRIVQVGISEVVVDRLSLSWSGWKPKCVYSFRFRDYTLTPVYFLFWHSLIHWINRSLAFWNYPDCIVR